MKLKHLFDNRDLARMLLAYWQHDDTTPPLDDTFRISANAVYRFTQNGQPCFLRFAPEEEKSPAAVEAELAFIAHLRAADFPAARPLPAEDGALVVRAQTPWGPYVATAFAGAPGLPLCQCPQSEGLWRQYGALLGRLHGAGQTYTAPAGQARPDWALTLTWCEDTLQSLGGHEDALREAGLLRTALAALPQAAGSYGLIHYDFEMDNVFWDEADGQFTAIDFDDAVVHWYAMDLVQAVNSLHENLPGESHAPALAAFLAGYQEVLPLDTGLMGRWPLFERYANLLAYTRAARSTAEHWRHEPAWMAALRAKLAALLAESRGRFEPPPTAPAAGAATVPGGAQREVFYIGGSPCSGKSTVAELLAQQYGLTYYKLDDHLDDLMKAAAEAGGPHSAAALQLDFEAMWMRPPEVQCAEELAIYEEMLPHVLRNIAALGGEGPVVAEGAGFLPALMHGQGADAAHYVCIVPTEAFQREKYAQRPWVSLFLQGCSNPEAAFGNWMARDALFARTVLAQAKALGYTGITVDGGRPPEDIAAQVAALFRLPRG